MDFCSVSSILFGLNYITLYENCKSIGSVLTLLEN
jgi:hypothetical protein